MPRPLSIATALEKSNLESGTAFLVMLEITVIDPFTKEIKQVIRTVANNEDIYFEGNEYTASVFDVSFSEESGESGQATVSMNDYRRIIRQQEEAVGGPIGFGVRLLIVNSGTLNEAPELDVSYSVTGSSSKDYKVSWTLGAENVLALPFPPHRQYKNNCRFRYKGESCGYVGPLETCSLTLDGENGCKSHENTINFGAFVGLNS